jgi:hypothetical protein
VTNPNVAPSKRIGPLRNVLNHPDSTPAFVHSALRRWSSRPINLVGLPFESPEEFKAVVLRLRARYQTGSTAGRPCRFGHRWQ